MKKLMLSMTVATLACSLALPAFAQQARWGTPEEATVKLILAGEQMWLDSSCSAQPGLNKVLADDFQGTWITGSRYGKKDAMSPDSPLDIDCQLGQIKVHFFGDAAAVVYGSESSLRKTKHGKRQKRCLVWTDTWLKRAGKWQIVAAQDNQVTCPQGDAA